MKKKETSQNINSLCDYLTGWLWIKWFQDGCYRPPGMCACCPKNTSNVRIFTFFFLAHFSDIPCKGQGTWQKWPEPFGTC